MKRREFIGFTGVTAAMIFSGRFVTTSNAWSGIIDEPGRLSPGMGRLPRMLGGRCHDHRLFMNDPDPVFEREIFGI